MQNKLHFQRPNFRGLLRAGPLKEILARIFRRDLFQFPQEFPHAFVHRLRHDDLQLDVLIPAMPRERTDGTPFSRRRSFCPLLVPGGTRSSERPSIVGTSIFAPRAASVTVMGTVV
jgi:hypothetical protein